MTLRCQVMQVLWYGTCICKRRLALFFAPESFEILKRYWWKVNPRNEKYYISLCFQAMSYEFR